MDGKRTRVQAETAREALEQVRIMQKAGEPVLGILKDDQLFTIEGFERIVDGVDDNPG